MSFLKIKDPVKRDQIVKEYLATKKRIRDSQLAEKTGEIELQKDLSKFFKPITETQKEATKEITEGLKPIKEGIEQLPKELPHPSLSILGDLEEEEEEEEMREFISLKDIDRTFGIYEEGGKKYIGNKEFDYDGKRFWVGKEAYPASRGLWELITSNNPKSENYTDRDYSNYVDILEQTSALHRGNNPANPYPKANKGDKWKFVKSIWEKEKTRLPRIATPSKERLSSLSPLAKRDGKGITIIPSNPNSLLERLDLLMASKEAGNTGVRNELVSICDELKRQGILKSSHYKKLMSIL